MAAAIVVVSLFGGDKSKRVAVKETDSWEDFTAKVCAKLGIEALHCVVGEEDGAELDDVEELMSGDRLVVYQEAPASTTPGAVAASAGEGKHEADEAPSTVSDGPDSAPAALSEVAAAIDDAALSLRKRNGASEVAACLNMLSKLIANAHKGDAKFHTIRLTHPRIAGALARHPQGVAMLAAAGFHPSAAPLGAEAPTATEGKSADRSAASTGGGDAPSVESLGLTHEFMVLPATSELRISVPELEQTLAPHLAWAERHTSSVAGSASYNLAKRELAKVRAEHGVSDAGSVPSDERWKLYPVYLAAKAKFDAQCAAAGPVERCPSVSNDPHLRGVEVAEAAAVEDSQPAAAGAGGDEMDDAEILEQLGGPEGLGQAQALLTAAGGTNTKAQAKARKAAHRLNRLGRHAATGCRVRIVFQDLVTIVARFSPFEQVDAIQAFVAECAAGSSPQPDFSLFKYDAKLDKGKTVLQAGTVARALQVGQLPDALQAVEPHARLGLEGIAPAGTVVVVWTSASPPIQPGTDGAAQGCYLSDALRKALPSKPNPVSSFSSTPASTPASAEAMGGTAQGTDKQQSSKRCRIQ